MSVVKFSSGSSAAKMIAYLSQSERGGQEKCVASENNLGVKTEQVAQAWEMTREEFNNEGGREYYHASFNVNPADGRAKEVTNEELLNIGGELAARMAPGHDYAAFVHRDREHPHVHVVWNTVNSESGKKYQQSPLAFEQAFKIKDELDRKYGLEITEKVPQRDRISDPAQRQYARNSQSYIWTEDLKERITMAQGTAKSLTEFKEGLSKRGVSVIERGKEQKFTYRFTDETGKKRAIREGRLGSDYSRETSRQNIHERGFGQKRSRGNEAEAGIEYNRSYTHGGNERDAGISLKDGESKYGAGRAAGGGQQAAYANGEERKRDIGANERLYRLGFELIYRYGKADRGEQSVSYGPAFENRGGVGKPGLFGKVKAMGIWGERVQRNLFRWLGWMEGEGVAGSEGGLSNGRNFERDKRLSVWRAGYGHISKGRETHRSGNKRTETNEPGGTSKFGDRYESGLVSAFSQLRGRSQVGFATFRSAFDRGVDKSIGAHERIREGTARGIFKSAKELREGICSWAKGVKGERGEIDVAQELIRGAHEHKLGRKMNGWELSNFERKIGRGQERSRGMSMGR